MTTSTLVILAVVAVVIVVLAAALMVLRKRSQNLQSTFGPEYGRTVHEMGRYKGESALEKRAKRVEQLHIRELSQADRERFTTLWRSSQAEFVDDPKKALVNADLLVTSAMNTRGYPVRDFEQCAEDISVDHGTVVDNYRAAHAITLRCAQGAANTEEIRQAMIHYRTLFDDLLPAAQPEVARLRRAV